MDGLTLATIITLSSTPQLPEKKPPRNPTAYHTSYVQPALDDHQRIHISAPENPFSYTPTPQDEHPRDYTTN